MATNHKHFIICLKEEQKKQALTSSEIEHFLWSNDKKAIGLIPTLDTKLTAELIAKVIKDFARFRSSTKQSQLEKFFSPKKRSEVEKKWSQQVINRIKNKDWGKVFTKHDTLLETLRTKWDQIVSDDITEQINRNFQKVAGELLQEKVIELRALMRINSLPKLKSQIDQILSPELLSTLHNRWDEIFGDYIKTGSPEGYAMPKSTTQKKNKSTNQLKGSVSGSNNIIEAIRENAKDKLGQQKMDEIRGTLQGVLTAPKILELVLLWEEILDPALYEERDGLRTSSTTSNSQTPIFKIDRIFNDKALGQYERTEYNKIGNDKIRRIYRLFDLRINCSINHKQLRNTIRGLKKVEFADMDERQACHLQKIDNRPFDKDNQYAYSIINCPNKFKVENSDVEVRIAVIDSGVDYENTELLPFLCDEGGSFGKNFVKGSRRRANDPKEEASLNDLDPKAETSFGHGTHVAGIIASMCRYAVSGNEEKERVLPKVKIKSYKVFPDGSKSSIIQALVDAANDSKVRVINNSWGPNRRRSSLATYETIIEYIKAKRKKEEVILVFSAGNSKDEVKYYPPACRTDVITVAAINRACKLIRSSNYGELVDIAAPGQDIWSVRASAGPLEALAGQCQSSGKVATNYANQASKRAISKIGTSMAAPFVSAAIALILTKKENKRLGYKEIKEKLSYPGQEKLTVEGHSFKRLDVSKLQK